MKGYMPDELFDEEGRLMPELAQLAPEASSEWVPIGTQTAARSSEMPSESV